MPCLESWTLDRVPSGKGFPFERVGHAYWENLDWTECQRTHRSPKRNKRLCLESCG